MVVMKGSNCSLLLRGSTEQLMGAMAAGRASHTLCSSPSRTPKLCSKTAYMIRPIPKEGSITEGTMSTTVCVCGGGGMYAGVQDFHRTVVSVLVTLRSGGLAHHGWSSGIS